MKCLKYDIRLSLISFSWSLGLRNFWSWENGFAPRRIHMDDDDNGGTLKRSNVRDSL